MPGTPPTVGWPATSPAELRDGLSGIGGGRGVFAKEPLKAGQLILVEAPLVTVPADKADEVWRGLLIKVGCWARVDESN
jgi:hypothetical protein